MWRSYALGLSGRKHEARSQSIKLQSLEQDPFGMNEARFLEAIPPRFDQRRLLCEVLIGMVLLHNA